MAKSALLQGIFMTQGSNLGLLHWRQILYQLSHQGRPTVCGTGLNPKTSPTDHNELERSELMLVRITWKL